MERKFNQISPHIYVFPHDGFADRPNIGLIKGTKYTLLYDAGTSSVHVKLMQQDLIKQGLPLPDFCCLSHWHWDHSYGAHAWQVPVIAGRETNEQLKVMQQWKWDERSMEERIVQGDEIKFCHEMIKREYSDRNRIRVATADIVFNGTLSIDLGGLVCNLIHCKGPHSSDSVLCYVPSDRFVFLGDSNCKDLYGLPWEFNIEYGEDFKKNTDMLTYDKRKVEKYLNLLDKLNFDHCISGHADIITRKQLYSKFERNR